MLANNEHVYAFFRSDLHLGCARDTCPLHFLVLKQSFVLFLQLREMSFDEIPEGTIVQTEAGGDIFSRLGRSFVDTDRLGVLLHAAARHHASVGVLYHSLPCVQLRLVLFEVAAETFRMQSVYRSDCGRR